MNAYLVHDGESYVIVAADNRREALSMFPTEYAEHCRLLERDVEGSYGDITFEYQRTRGVDLILSGVIEPNWFNEICDPTYDDYRDWNGFTSAPVFNEI